MDIDWLEAEIDRLSALPKAEVGIPMFLVPEDLSAPAAAQDAPAGSSDLSRAFDAALAGLEARRGPLSPRDLAAVIEVLAEHRFLDRPFSSIGEEAAR